MQSKSSVLEQDNQEAPHIDIIGSQVTAIPFNPLIELILVWAKQRVSKFVCVANTHMLVEAHQSSSFKKVMQHADLVTPDGMPLVWMLRMMGVKKQDRVAGLDLLQALCQKAEKKGISVYFLGSQDSILGKMRSHLQHDYPNLEIAGMESLPFGPSVLDVDSSLIQRVNASGAGLVMVALGCPKQEYWMSVHKNQINAVMIGLGGAFPVYAGINRRAKSWVRQMGMEWFYRLIQEPKRLWKRYATSIPIFIYLAIKQLCYRFARLIFR